MAVEFEIRMCSNKNAPTGTIPVSECSRRRTNDIPWPARNGATPPRTSYLLTPGAEELADATEAPYKFCNEKRTFHYRATEEVKSRNPRVRNGDVENLATASRSLDRILNQCSVESGTMSWHIF